MSHKTTTLNGNYFNEPEPYLRLATLSQTERMGRYRIDVYDFGSHLIDGEIYLFAACAFESNSSRPALSIVSIRCMLTLRTGGPISPTPTLLIFQHGPDGKVSDPGLNSDDWKDIALFVAKAKELIGERLDCANSQGAPDNPHHVEGITETMEEIKVTGETNSEKVKQSVPKQHTGAASMSTKPQDYRAKRKKRLFLLIGGIVVMAVIAWLVFAPMIRESRIKQRLAGGWGNKNYSAWISFQDDGDVAIEVKSLSSSSTFYKKDKGWISSYRSELGTQTMGSIELVDNDNIHMQVRMPFPQTDPRYSPLTFDIDAVLQRVR